jgi:TonB family protein
MAFEAFLQPDDARPRWRRRLTLTISIVLHAALLAGGIAYSFWHVEEITPPTVRVTFLASAPPPSPAPSPSSGGNPAPKKSAKVTPKPTLTALVQPKLETPKKTEPKPQEPDDDDPDQAFAPGQAGNPGTAIGNSKGPRQAGDPHDNPPGTDGPAAAPPKVVAPKMLAPQLGALQKDSGADPEFPAVLRRSGMVYTVLSKICVSRSGTVESVSILKGADSMLDRNVVNAVKGWRYHPLLADNNAIPFCYFGRFEFKAN